MRYLILLIMIGCTAPTAPVDCDVDIDPPEECYIEGPEKPKDEPIIIE